MNKFQHPIDCALSPARHVSYGVAPNKLTELGYRLSYIILSKLKTRILHGQVYKYLFYRQIVLSFLFDFALDSDSNFFRAFIHFADYGILPGFECQCITVASRVG